VVPSAVQLPHRLLITAATHRLLRAEGRKYVSAKNISQPVKITAKGKDRWIYPSTWTSKQKDEFLGQNSNPKKQMKCRPGIHYNETTGVYLSTMLARA
jgi:hypothetical protein